MKISELFEARNPSLSYKEKKVKDVLDRVIVELNGNDSGVMSRLTTRYSRLDKSAKLLQERRDELNLTMKAAAEELFDVTDEVLTRVVETVSYTITLAKAEKAEAKKPKEVIDYAAIVKDLAEMVPELEEKLKELTKKYTELVPPRDAKTPALRVKSKLEEGVVSSIKDAWKSLKGFCKDMMSWTKSYDKKLAALKEKANM